MTTVCDCVQRQLLEVPFSPTNVEYLQAQVGGSAAAWYQVAIWLS